MCWSAAPASYCSWCSTASCGRRGLTPAASAGSGTPTARPKVATACGGRPGSAATSAGWLRIPPTKTVPRPSDAAATTRFCAPLDGVAERIDRLKRLAEQHGLEHPPLQFGLRVTTLVRDTTEQAGADAEAKVARTARRRPGDEGRR